jgi:hypothetical protein
MMRVATRQAKAQRGIPRSFFMSSPNEIRQRGSTALASVICGQSTGAEASDGCDDKIHFLKWIGDSMQPTIKQGDWVCIDTSQRTPAHGIFAVRVGGVPCLYRLQPRTGKIVLMINDNPVYRHPPWQVPPQDLDIIGRVVGRMTKV